MPTIQESIAAAEAEIEECKSFLLIKVAHEQLMPNLMEYARFEALKGLEEVLTGYKRGLQVVQSEREALEAQGLKAPESLEKFFLAWEAAAEKIFIVYKESVMSRYQKNIGLK